MEKKEIKLNPTLDIWMITRLMSMVDKDYLNQTKNLPDTAQTEAFLEEVNKFPNQFSEIGKTVIIRNRLQDMMNVYNDSVFDVKVQKDREGSGVGKVVYSLSGIEEGESINVSDEIVGYEIINKDFEKIAKKFLTDYLKENKLLKRGRIVFAKTFCYGSNFHHQVEKAGFLEFWYKPIYKSRGENEN